MTDNTNNNLFSRVSTTVRRLFGRTEKGPDKQEPIVDAPNCQATIDPACQAPDLPEEPATIVNTDTPPADKQPDPSMEDSQISEPSHSIEDNENRDDDHPPLPNIVDHVLRWKKPHEHIRYPGPLPDLQALADKDDLSAEEICQIIDITRDDIAEMFFYAASRDLNFHVERADRKMVTTAKEPATALGDIDISDIHAILIENGLKPLGPDNFTKKVQTFLRKAFGLRPRNKAEYIDWNGFFAVALSSKIGRKYLLTEHFREMVKKDRKRQVELYEKNRRAYEELQAERLEYSKIEHTKESPTTPESSSAHTARPTKQKKSATSPPSPPEAAPHTPPQAFKTEEDILNNIKGFLGIMREKAGEGPVRESAPFPIDINALLQKQELSGDETRSILQVIDEKTGNIAYRKAAEYFGFKVAEVDGKVWSTAKELARALGYKNVWSVFYHIENAGLKPLDIRSFPNNLESLLKKTFNLSPKDYSTKFCDWKSFLAVGWNKQEVKDYFFSRETRSRLDTFTYQVAGLDAHDFATILEDAKTDDFSKLCAEGINTLRALAAWHKENKELNKQIGQPQQQKAKQPEKPAEKIQETPQEPPTTRQMTRNIHCINISIDEKVAILLKYNITPEDMMKIIETKMEKLASSLPIPIDEEVYKTLEEYINACAMANPLFLIALNDMSPEKIEKLIKRRFGIKNLRSIDLQDIREAFVYTDYLTEREPLAKEKLRKQLDQYRKARKERHYYRGLARYVFGDATVTLTEEDIK